MAPRSTYKVITDDVKAIRAMRERRGLSVNKAAPLIGTNKSTLTALENGRIDLSSEWIDRILKAYRLSFVNQDRNEEIIFLRYSADILLKHDCYLTNGNAFDAKTRFCKFTQLDDIKIVDAKGVNAWYFNKSDEDKRLKQAEVLVFEQLPDTEILDIVCFNDRTRTQVLEILARHGKKITVWISQNFYVVKK